jgi:sigma-B regulation protein RsbU (phosphoserine phosphatase)
MAEALADNPSREVLYQRIVHAAIFCTGALSACIFERMPGDKMRGVAVEGLFPPHRPLPEVGKGKLTTRARFIEQVLKSETFSVHEGLVGRVALTCQGILVADAANHPDVVKHDDPVLAVKSMIVVPLVFGGQFFGVLAVANPADGLPFTETDYSLLQSMAEQAALALHNAEFLHLQLDKRQYDMDLSLASGIQQMLLPNERMTLPGLDIDARYTPAQKVGGDLYDIIVLGEHRIGVVVADVSGKGISASLLMAICRSNIRQIAPRHTSPSEVLAELNRVLSHDIRNGMFVTLLYAVIDTDAMSVTFARAGHELPLLVQRYASVGAPTSRFVSSDGMPVGMVPDELFSTVISDCTEPFRPGDAFVLYTDGITEAPNEDGKEFSGARLADAVSSLQTNSAREINDGLMLAIDRFIGGAPQRDDYTLVTIKRF